jgi:hypothetical protein
MGKLMVLLLATLMLACSTGSGPSTATPTPSTWEFQLTLINGDGAFDANVEAEFREILDRFQAGEGSCPPEPNRGLMALTLLSNWRDSGESVSLLEWSEAAIRACG